MQFFRNMCHLFHLSLVTFSLSTDLLSYVLGFIFCGSNAIYFFITNHIILVNNILYRFKFVGLTLDAPSTYS